MIGFYNLIMVWWVITKIIIVSINVYDSHMIIDEESLCAHNSSYGNFLPILMCMI
jgi:hypothetical protein